LSSVDSSVEYLGRARQLALGPPILGLAVVTAALTADIPAARWLIGGSDVQRPTALVEIQITAGTNTVAEKAAFVALAHAELQQQLGAGGPLEAATYVVVQELPATDWGYGGQTQAARRQAVAPGAAALAVNAR
jgi:4-oxalocrotonate tautomerase